MSRAVRLATLLGILALAAGLRFTHLDWDQRQGLHPDERFLAMVSLAVSAPADPGLYFDEARSPLNPRNAGFAFFAYGSLPTTALRLLAESLHRVSYGDVLLLGRIVSALASTATVLLAYALASTLLRDRRVALLAALLQAVAVLPVQHAHFFVVDEPAACLSTASLLFLARWRRSGRAAPAAVAGLLLGAALACKVSVALLVVPFVAAAAALARKGPDGGSAAAPAGSGERGARRALLGLGVAGLAAAAAFRLLEPTAFSGLFSPSPRWIANLEEARRLVSGEADVPPGVQWAGRTRWLFPLRNLVLFGLGPALGVAALVASALAALALVRRRDDRLLLPLAAVAVFLVHQGGQFVSSMRYLLPIYPCLAILAAWGLVDSLDRARARRRSGLPRGRAAHAAAVAACVGVPVLTLLWALAFTSVYRRPHTRIVASRWIYANVPPGSTIGCEHWDDALPLRLDGRDPAREPYRGVKLAWYDPDTPKKLEAALGWLDAADVLVLSSDRLSGSIPRLPLRWPLTTRYYRLLEEGRLGFDLAATFTSRPSLFGVDLPDDGAEEAFSVYDHPRVRIYRKSADYDREKVRALLGAVPLDEALSLTPLESSRYPDWLRLPERLREAHRLGGTWAEIFPGRPGGAGSRAFQVTLWSGALVLLSLAGAPLVRAAAPALPDGGYALGRVAGLLLAGWVSWLLASLGLVPFTRGGIAASFLLVLGAAGAAAIATRQKEKRAAGGWIPIEEGLFWAAFAGFLAIRWWNPDLWHPSQAGAEPRDLAYLGAVVKSETFPPYDPWYAGGTLNVRYLGLVLVGQLVKLTGIVPEVAVNLATATLFALAVSAAFGVTLAVCAPPPGAPRRPALLAAGAGALLVTVLGSLGPVPAERTASDPRPFSAYLLADLHAHATALPLALLAAGLAVALARWRDRAPGGQQARLLLAFALLALSLGALLATDAWTFLCWGAAAGALLAAGRGGLVPSLRAAAIAAAAGALGVLLFLPFHRAFGSPEGALRSWHGPRTPPLDYALAHGLPLGLLGALLLVELRSASAAAPVRFLRGALRTGGRGRRFRSLFRGRVRPTRAFRRALDALAAVLAVALVALRAGAPLAGLLLVVLAALALALAGRRAVLARRLPLVLAGVGVLLTLVPEVVVLRGDAGRTTTLHELWLAAWPLLAIASAAAVPRLLEAWRGRGGALAGAAALGLLVLLSASVSLRALRLRLADRAAPGAPRTLDGLRSVALARTRVAGSDVAVGEDLPAIDWLRSRVAGTPVVLEANAHPREDGWGGRISSFTGLPTVVGPQAHERRLRGAVEREQVYRRISDVERLYRTRDAEELARLLARYRIELVVVGGLERAVYGSAGLVTRGGGVPGLLVPAFAAAGVELYRVPAASGPGSAGEPRSSGERPAQAIRREAREAHVPPPPMSGTISSSRAVAPARSKE